MSGLNDPVNASVEGVPRGWIRRRLRFDCRVNPKKSEISLEPEAEVSFIPMEAVGELGGLNLEQVRPLDGVYDGYTYLADDDVCVAKITPCFENGKGALALGLKNGVGFGTTELHVLRAAPELSPRFLFYASMSHAFRHLGTSEMIGAGGQKRVPEDFIKDWLLARPPLEKQDCIADFLDKRTAQIDGLIAKKQRLLELLAEKRQALITRAVTKGLNPNAPMKPSGIDWLSDIPAHWRVVSLNKVTTKITNGYVGPTRDILVESGVRYIQSLHIKNNLIVFRDDFFVTPEWSEIHSKSILRKDDVLIVQTGAVGEVAHVTEEFEGCNCHALIICTPDHEKLTGRFLSWLLCSDYGQEFLQMVKTGALHPHLNCGNVKFFPVTVPPLAEQILISEWISAAVDRLERMTTKVRRSVDRLREYRCTLITAAVKGQLEVSHD